MTPSSRWLLLVLVLVGGVSVPAVRAEPIEIDLLQLNDVYEITRPKKKDLGGLTRVATLRKQLLAANPNTISILAGDFFSPSALGTAKVDGKRLDGKQMVAVLNTVKLDYATFGNHEFDISEGAFQDRLKESRFKWFSGNITDTAGKPFPGVEPYRIIPFKSKDGKEVKLALIGVTLDTPGKNPKEQYWKYHNYLESAKKQVAELKDKADIVVAVTHLELADDQKLAREVAGIDLILGGHEHENNTWRSRTPGVAPIFKADANVRTVYVHRLHFDPVTRNLDIESQLITVTNQIREDEETIAVVEKWRDQAFEALRAESGYDPQERVATTTEDLDGREAHVRRQPTNLTNLVGNSLLHAVKDADLAVYNSGSIRIDDLIPEGPLTFYDVLRILPFGGKVQAAEVKGGMLQKLFDVGLSADVYGHGSFLQTVHVESAGPGKWKIGTRPLDPKRTYIVAVNDYLLAGRETDLSFFKPGSEVKPLEFKADLRDALVKELQTQYREKKVDKPVKEVVKPAPPAAKKVQWDAVLGLAVGVVLLTALLYLGWKMSRTPPTPAGQA